MGAQGPIRLGIDEHSFRGKDAVIWLGARTLRAWRKKPMSFLASCPPHHATLTPLIVLFEMGPRQP
jgi:hypothetical protein